MDRLPLRLLAFALGPLVARRAAGASRAAAVAGQTPRALRPSSAATASEDVAPAGDVARSSPWLLASAGAAAVAIAAVVASQEHKRPEPQRRQQMQTSPAKEATRDADFGGV